jgi:hypothetical protein
MEQLASAPSAAPHAAPDAPATAERTAWREVALPLGHGLLAHAQGHYQQAAKAMQPVMHRLQAIGGSHAQRDLFERVLQDARSRCGLQ